MAVDHVILQFGFQDISRVSFWVESRRRGQTALFCSKCFWFRAKKWRNGCWDLEVQLISSSASLLSVTLTTDTCWSLPFITPIPPSGHTYPCMTPCSLLLTVSPFTKHTVWPFCCKLEYIFLWKTQMPGFIVIYYFIFYVLFFAAVLLIRLLCLFY